MKKKIILGLIVFLIILFNPQGVIAQSCGGNGAVCTGIGSQSSCCAGYNCESGGAPGSTVGNCRQSLFTACGDLGQPCCATTGCAGGNTCSPGNVCVNPTGIPVGGGTTGTTTGAELCSDKTKINTAIGCIPVLTDDNGVSFMGWILKWAVGIGGGIAFLLILYGGFMVMTSQGNPERVKAGQELITSAISGLVLLVLSIFLLKFIGVDILGLGAFGFGGP